MYPLSQFSILRHHEDNEDWRTIQLDDEWFLNFHKDVPVQTDKKKDLIIVGLVWQTADKPAPIDLEPNGFDFDKEEATWGGRYIVIHNGYVYTDASAMLGVFYSKYGVSGDISILAKEAGYSRKIAKTKTELSWFPGPGTHYDDIKRVLPIQKYNYKTGEIFPREMLVDTSMYSREELTPVLSEHYIRAIQNMYQTLGGMDVLLALTGGHDSRTTAAVMQKSGIPYRIFSIGYKYITRGDREIPGQIAKALGKDYFYVEEKRKMDKKRLDEYDYYTSGLARDKDREFYARGQYDDLVEMNGGKPVVIVRSGIWDAGTRLYERVMKNGTFKAEYEVDKNSPEERSIDEYFAWVKKYPQKRLNDDDTFFFSQREACWLSTYEQGFEITDDIVSIEILNCRLLISLYLSYPRDEQFIKKHNEEIIRANCPEILDFPYEHDVPDDLPLEYLIRTKIYRGMRRLKNLGIRGTIKTYTDIKKRSTLLEEKKKDFVQNSSEN